jgi:cyclophilin family peptidyl-prolyl cis-trans isomerase
MRQKTTKRAVTTPGEMLERLEGRQLLANSPFPQLSDLRSANHTVVRLQTNFGDVDFEMFDDAAPGVVANFLKYVRDGDYDKTFFHRYATTQVSQSDPTQVPFVLQGGLGRLTSPQTSGTITAQGGTAYETIPTDPAVTNEFNQSNLARTVAMARLGGQPNSATSQFFINLRDNTFLDNDSSNGFTVFARVATDASWAVVQNIITTVQRPFHVNGQTGNLFEDIPTTNGFTGSNVNEDQMVTIRDAEIIKPANVAAFYTYRVFYPEGFAGSTINEFLPLGNPNSSAVSYQVIVRSEGRDPRPSGNTDFWYRDKVVGTGSIAGNRRGGLTVSTFTNPSGNLVPRQGMPYGYEVWATGPIDAMISHYDFGSSTIEAFTGAPATTWTMPEVRKRAGTSDFLVWQNTTDQAATVTLRFYKADGSAPIEMTMTTEAFRRNGLNINTTDALASGATYAVQITSDQPIVAAVTQYKTTGADRGGATMLGVPGSAQTRGVLPVANNGATDSGTGDRLSFLNTGSTAAFVTIVARFDDGSPDFTITSAPTLIPAGARASFQLPDADALRNKSYSLIYTSGSAPVYASVVHIEHGDVASNAFAYTAATVHDFAEGFMDSARAGHDVFETLAFYNPGSFFGNNQGAASVTVRFLFTDGFVLTQDVALAADGRSQLDLHTFQPLLAQNANGRFYYSLQVVSDVPIVAMMRHYDLTLGDLQPSGGDSTIGTQRGTVTTLAGTPPI